MGILPIEMNREAAGRPHPLYLVTVYIEIYPEI